MPLIYKGLRTVPTATDTNDGTKSKSAVMTWDCIPDETVDGEAAILALPFNLDGAFVGWNYTVDPLSQQGSFTFGNVKAVRFSASGIQPFVSTTQQFVAGSSYIYSESSGELIATCFPKPIILPAGLYGNAQQPVTRSFVSPMNATSKIQLFIGESLFTTSILEIIPLPSYTISLYNYNVPPLGAI